MVTTAHIKTARRMTRFAFISRVVFPTLWSHGSAMILPGHITSTGRHAHRRASKQEVSPMAASRRSNQKNMMLVTSKHGHATNSGNNSKSAPEARWPASNTISGPPITIDSRAMNQILLAPLFADGIMRWPPDIQVIHTRLTPAPSNNRPPSSPRPCSRCPVRRSA